jgi:hypothetical protein
MAYFDSRIEVPIPSALATLIAKASSKHNLSAAEYGRHALAAALRADGFNPPEVERRISDRRAAAILALPEARGRKSLAEHLAVETKVSVEVARDLLSKAGQDEGELGAEIASRYLVLRGVKK